MEGGGGRGGGGGGGGSMVREVSKALRGSDMW